MRQFDRAGQQKDRKAFASLYEQTHLAVYRYVYSLHGGPRKDVEDLTAETFTKAWNARRRFQGDEKAALGWLLSIARNLVIDVQRRGKTSGYVVSLDDAEIVFEDVSIEERAIEKEKLEILIGLMQALSIENREILILRYILGWRVKDIATRLSLAENTLSVKIRRLLKKLRDRWIEEA